MKDNINKYIKFREEFRPFAPAILDEKKTDYFDMELDDEVFFMEKVFPFLEEVKKQVPAVVHEDGTGRVQTVTENSNMQFYKLIKEFYKLTQIPILLNTSFNTNNVPIVNSPRDAIDTFYRCGIDILYMNNIKVSK
jgi:carbamoyltransferase